MSEIGRPVREWEIREPAIIPEREPEREPQRETVPSEPEPEKERELEEQPAIQAPQLLRYMRLKAKRSN